jgi:GT2 family glycosyltransferase
MSVAAQPEVTILVTPREKWSVCQDSLDSILANTSEPHRMVYVDAGSPPAVRRHVAMRAREHGFEVLRTRHYLTPNAARLKGLERVTTPYVVFIDNDVVVKPGWLGAMLDCARETGAAVVSPVVCQGSPAHEIVHCAGGECGVKQVETEEGPELHLFERIRWQGRRVDKLGERLRREQTGLAEFHCMMARTDIARLPGAIDAGIMNTREHVDFCMSVAEAGGSIWLEPTSIVTYLHDSKLTPADLPYFMLRWSDEWERRSLERVVEKRGLSTAGTMGKRLRNVGWRRRQYVVEPFAEKVASKVPIGRLRWPTRSLLVGAERQLNGLLTRAHAWRMRGGA